MALLYHIGADAVLILHAAFVLFVLFGGMLALRWPRLLRLHAPAAAWGALVEFRGWPCPLTPLENWLRAKAGSDPLEGDFVGRYVLPTLYPAGLTRDLQIILGILVLVVNLIVYIAVWRHAAKRLS